MLSAAMLLGPGCGASSNRDNVSRDEPLRRAGFRAIAARDYFATCPGAAAGPEMTYQSARHDELKQLAARTGAAETLALGENEWFGVSRAAPPERCESGDDAYRAALARYAGALDTLAARIADYPRPEGQRP